MPSVTIWDRGTSLRAVGTALRWSLQIQASSCPVLSQPHHSPVKGLPKPFLWLPVGLWVCHWCPARACLIPTESHIHTNLSAKRQATWLYLTIPKLENLKSKAKKNSQWGHTSFRNPEWDYFSYLPQSSLLEALVPFGFGSTNQAQPQRFMIKLLLGHQRWVPTSKNNVAKRIPEMLWAGVSAGEIALKSDTGTCHLWSVCLKHKNPIPITYSQALSATSWVHFLTLIFLYFACKSL